MYKSGKKFKAQHGKERFTIGEWLHKDGKPVLCKNGYHCSKGIGQALSYVQGDVLAVVEVKGKSDKQDDKECYSDMRIVKAYKWTKTDSVKLAIFAAEQVIDIFEKYNKEDKRPREAIEAAKKYLENPTKKNQDAAAGAAARAAAYSAYAAAYAAYAAADAAAARAHAAGAAADAAAHKKIITKIEKWLVNHLEELEEYES